MPRKNILLDISAFFIIPWFLIACTNTSPAHRVGQNSTTPGIPLKEALPHITAIEFKKIKDSGERFILLDVREKDEYNAAHLPGAVNISLNSLKEEVPDRIPNTDLRIYVYCMVGVRSAIAAQKLTNLGYTNVINISDSFKGWGEAGFPVYNQLGEFVMTPDGFEKKER